MKSSRSSAHRDARSGGQIGRGRSQRTSGLPHATRRRNVEKPLPHYSKPIAGRGGPYVIAAHAGVGSGLLAARFASSQLCTPSSILFFPISSFSFPTAYSLPVYLVPVPVYSAEITACLLKGKQKQANPTGQWTSFVLSVPLFFGHLHPARSNQRTYIPCLFPAHVQTVADKYNIFTTAAFLVISIPITQ